MTLAGVEPNAECERCEGTGAAFNSFGERVDCECVEKAYAALLFSTIERAIDLVDRSVTIRDEAVAAARTAIAALKQELSR